jgi:hypothetical protein
MSLANLPQLESINLESVETFDSQVMATVRSLVVVDCPFHEQEIRKLIQCLPSLSELTIDESLPEIFRVLLPDIPQGDATRTQVSAWPQLQTIGIFYLQSVDVPFLCNMVSVRQAGDPTGGSTSALRRILLDRRSRTVLRAKQRLEWLQEKVIVENVDLPEPWPTSLQYEDAHDLLD